MTALHVFDMDGTLLRETTASLEISARLGQSAPMREIEDRYAAGEVDERFVAARLAHLWYGLDQDLVDEVAASSPWIAGIDEVCADIAARGETSMLITLSPEFFARYLHRRGVDVVRGSAWPPMPLTRPLDPAGLMTPADKVHHTETERVRRRLPAAACVAYGDSSSDEPLFAHLPNTVAVNAGPTIEAAARVSYRGEDLRGAYAHGRALLEDWAGTP